MDKKEYKLLSEEIMSLTANEQFQEAAEIADRIDWRKVGSFSMLMKISELYQLNRRYEDALELMLLAYDRNPKQRAIVYGLCELYILLENYAKAMEFFTLYQRMAPNDSGVYILQYKLGELAGTSLEDQIALLEEFNRKDYREEWAYQLAYLYHRIGLGTKCVECCNELITWFGEGPFVIKAMELKMLHAKLNAEQQAIYDRRDDIADEIRAYESDEYSTESPEPGLNPETDDIDWHVKTIDMSKFNTMNLQKALAESMRELMGGEGRDSRITGEILKPLTEDDFMTTGEMEARMEQKAYHRDARPQAYPPEEYPQEEYPQDTYAQESYPGEEYPQEDYAQEGYPGEEYPQESYAQEEYPQDPVIENVPGELASEPEGVEDQTLYFAPVDMPRRSAPAAESTKSEAAANDAVEETEGDEVFFEDRTQDIIIDSPPPGTNPDYESLRLKARQVHLEEEEERRERAQRLPEGTEKRGGYTGRNGMEDMLYLDADGQIGLAMPDSAPVEKQITGQIHIDEYLSDWEKTKVKKLKQQQEDLMRNISERTGPILKDYAERKKNGIIEEMEREQKIFSEKYQADDITLRGVDEIAEEEAEMPADAADTPLAEAAPQKNAKHVPGAATLAAAEEGRNIWDEVREAIDADAAVAAATPPAPAPLQFSSGKAGFVDAAARSSSGVSIAGDMTELTDISEPAEEPAKEPEKEPEATPAAEDAADGLPTLEPAEELAEEPASTIDDAEEPAVDTAGDAAAFDEEAYPEEAAYTGETYTEEAYAEEAYSEEAYDEEPYDEAGYDEEAYGEDGYDAAYAGEEAYTGEDGYLPEEAADMNEFDMNTEQIRAMGNALEADADDVSERTVEELNDEYYPEEESELSPDEQKLFADFLYSKKMRSQLLEAIDNISLASYVGNAIVTGDNDSGLLDLGKALVKEIQMIDPNFVTSRVARISGTKMNRRDIPTMFKQIAGGALLVEQASNITRETLETVARTLDGMTEGIFIILMDNKRDMDRMLGEYEMITGYFNARIDIAPMNNNALVDYAKKYAYSQEYKIDEERGVLALHQRISELQIGEHNVSTREIEDIIDEAIEHSRKPRLGTFFQVLGGKRYDYEDMIVLREKDFV